MFFLTIVSINSPLNELDSACLGQAGSLTNNVRQIQADAKQGNLERIARYVKGFRDYIDDAIRFRGFWKHIKEYASDRALDIAGDQFLKALGNSPLTNGARCNANFLNEPDVQENLATYLAACCDELDSIAQTAGHDLPPISRIIFGHTHQAISLDTTAGNTFPLAGAQVSLYNTGGWIGDPHKSPVGGLVIKYDSSSGWSDQLL